MCASHPPPTPAAPSGRDMHAAMAGHARGDLCAVRSEQKHSIAGAIDVAAPLHPSSPAKHAPVAPGHVQLAPTQVEVSGQMLLQLPQLSLLVFRLTQILGELGSVATEGQSPPGAAAAAAGSALCNENGCHFVGVRKARRHSAAPAQRLAKTMPAAQPNANCTIQMRINSAALTIRARACARATVAGCCVQAHIIACAAVVLVAIEVNTHKRRVVVAWNRMAEDICAAANRALHAPVSARWWWQRRWHRKCQCAALLYLPIAKMPWLPRCTVNAVDVLVMTAHAPFPGHLQLPLSHVEVLGHTLLQSPQLLLSLVRSTHVFAQ